MNLIKPAAWSDAVLGVWLLAAPAVIGYQATRPVTVLEDLVPGLFLCATSAMILARKLRPIRIEWLQALCGVWLVAGSIALVFSRQPRAALNSVFVGVAVLMVSLCVWLTTGPRTRARAAHQIRHV
jgi:ABC-type thiamin/hydroxymethylpyrimidine transport system permease subunit